MLCAGADVCVASADGSCTWVDVEDLCRPQKKCRKAPQAALDLLDKQQAVITAVCLPLPLSSSSKRMAFWSHKLTAHRQFNEHAVVNAAMWLEWPTSSSSSGDGDGANTEAAADGYDIRIAIGTYQRVACSYVPATVHDSSHMIATGHDTQQQQQQPPHSSGDEGVWLCGRAYELETNLLKVLEGPQEGSEDRDGPLALLPCLPWMLGMDLLRPYKPAGRLAAYVE